jgi:hypothetical protein
MQTPTTSTQKTAMTTTDEPAPSLTAKGVETLMNAVERYETGKIFTKKIPIEIKRITYSHFKTIYMDGTDTDSDTLRKETVLGLHAVNRRVDQLELVRPKFRRRFSAP